MRFIYIHGFNSGPQSRSGAALEQLLREPVAKIHNDYSLPYPMVMAKLREQIMDSAREDERLCVMGTSLGGFYALQLRLPNLAKVAAWNPVVFPALQLKQFQGENVRFTDGQTWEFSAAARLSYAEAPDPRQWRNFTWDGAAPAPRRQLWLGSLDEVLEHQIAAVYWGGHAPIEIMRSGHSIEDFAPALPFLKQT